MRLSLLGIICFISSFAAESKLPHDIRIDPNGFEAQEADILAVCKSAGAELQKYAPSLPTENVVVIHDDKSSPITLFQRNDQHEIVVKLNTHKTFWSQYAYQFAHEICHVHCGFRPGPSDNLWFEETICETSSLFCLRAMAHTWQTQPPYPNWKSFAPKLQDYADQVIKKRTYLAEINQKGLAKFYRDHATELQANPTQRELNGAMAVKLVDFLEAQPQRWAAFQWLNATEKPAHETFAAYLQRWEKNCPEAAKATVQDIRKLFEVR
jgi:hypothetical protein